MYQHPQLKFIVCPYATHYDTLHNLCTIVFMFYPLQSFGYQSQLISSNLCMLSLLGLNYVGSEHDTDSPWTNTYPLQFLTEVLIFPVMQLVSSLQNKIFIFHTMIPVWVWGLLFNTRSQNKFTLIHTYCHKLALIFIAVSSLYNP